MKFKGLNGRDYNVDLNEFKVVGSRGSRGKRSSYHKAARKLLQRKFNGYQILEEMKVQGASTRTLYLDFFIPVLDIAVEVHGEQHYKFIKHFHKNRTGYINALKRDRLKKEWCEFNGLDYIVFKFSEQVEWENQIDDR